MTNTLEEAIAQFNKSQKVTKPKNNQIIAYAMIGVGIVMIIFLLAEVTGVRAPKPQQKVDPQAALESKAKEQEEIIKQAEKQKKSAELRKQAADLELQALINESNVSN